MKTARHTRFSFTVIAAFVLMVSLTLSSCGTSGGGGGGNTNTTPNPTYTVTYDSNGSDIGIGSVPVDTTTYETGQTVTVPGNTGMLAKAGFFFTGWNTKADGTGTTYAQAQTFLMGAANVTLFAKWTANPTYTVTYDANVNAPYTSTGSVPIDTTHYEAGATVAVSDNTGNLATNKYSNGIHLTFNSWNTQADGNGTTYAPGQTFIMAAANVTLYAKWTANLTVTYDGNGNTGGSVPTDSTKYEEGNTVTVLGNTGNLVNTGHSFSGWNTQADGNGTTYGATFAMGSTNVILYAKWVILFTDNGDGTMTDQRTGLMWLKAPDATQRQWQPSMDYSDTLNFAGHADWRLPTVTELSGLIQGWTGSPAGWLTSQGFSNVQAYSYWSSSLSTYNPTTDAIYFFMFYNQYGTYADGSKTNSFYVLPVRP